MVKKDGQNTLKISIFPLVLHPRGNFVTKQRYDMLHKMTHIQFCKNDDDIDGDKHADNRIQYNKYKMTQLTTSNN